MLILPVLTEIYPKFAKPFFQLAGPKNIQHNNSFKTLIRPQCIAILDWCLAGTLTIFFNLDFREILLSKLPQLISTKFYVNLIYRKRVLCENVLLCEQWAYIGRCYRELMAKSCSWKSDGFFSLPLYWISPQEIN